MAWSDERVAILKKMWLDGNSASEIAKELGDITRNAVIGKVHRLGLSNRDTNFSGPGDGINKAVKNVKRGRPPKVDKEPKKKRGRPQKIKETRVFHETADKGKSITATSATKRSNGSKPEVVSDLSEETLKTLLKIEMKSKKISLMDLTERTCKWPIGDPATDSFWFCGHEAEQGKPYCKTHISIAFQPITQRRNRKES
ncbi:MAG: GcrA family cell cycle regulator [Paracoccaceae bacterium]